MKKYIVTVNGTSYEVFVEEAGVGTPVTAPVQAPVISTPAAEQPVAEQPVSAAPATQAPAAPSGSKGSVEVLAPMAGTVVNILVSVGDSVTKGQTLFVLEALKMENNVPSPIDGTVASVNVARGSSVDSDAVIVTLN